MSTKNLTNFSSETTLDTLEDSYENLKYMNSLYDINLQTVLLTKSSSVQPVSYTQVLDTFRSDYDELAQYSTTLNPQNGYYNNDLHTDSIANRMSNSMRLRSSARNSIITYNAIQKVFKSRFDEGRSHARLQDFSNSLVTHPFLTESKSPYESMLGKNKESFFNINFYKPRLLPTYNLTIPA